MSDGPEHSPESSPPAAAEPPQQEAAAPAIVPMRVMRVISVGNDGASASDGPSPDSADGPSGGASLAPAPTVAPAPDWAPQGRASDGPERSAHEEELGEEEFEEDEPTPAALSDEDLEDSHSEEPPPVVEESEPTPLPLVTKSVRPPAPEPQAAAAELAPPPVPSDRKPPTPPQRSAKPALPSAKARRKPWWEEVFGDDFSRAHKALSETQVSHEADFIAGTLELGKGAVVLDLCCGQGQHAVELSRRGFPVVGYDLSVFQLAVAADYAQSAHQKINFLQGDMREMAFDAMFSAIVCWDTSFGYFEEEKNVDVAKRMFAALKPGGSLLLDIMNRDYSAREAPSNHWFEGDGCICMDDMSLDWITSRLKVKRSVILDDGRSKELTYSIRLYSLSEIGKILHDVGFRVTSVSGHTSTPGAFLGSRSPRIIIRAERPE